MSDRRKPPGKDRRYWLGISGWLIDVVRSRIRGERRSGFDRRARKSLAPLPADAECALQHAALVLSKTDPAAHEHVRQVLADHLPAYQPDGADSEGGDLD